MQIIGKLEKVFPEQSGVSKAGKDWIRQEFTIKTQDDKYPKTICFQDFGNKTDIAKLETGTDIEVYFNAESREWEGRYFTNLTAWKVVDLMAASHYEKKKQEKIDPPGDSDVLPF